MIPVSEPVLRQQDIENVLECLRTGWISSAGRFLEEFEAAWAARCGMRYGVAVSNGTTALQCAVACLELEPGDEVIMPSFTIISCALAALYNGAVPVLVDCDQGTWCMDVGQVAAKIGPRTRAIMPVHIYGHPVDMDPLLRLAKRHGLAIVEDAAEAHGAECLVGRELQPEGIGQVGWRVCGGFGTVSAFSFYANKLVTTGEGGMVLTNDAALAERLRSLRNLAFRRDRRFLHTQLGYNFRLTNLQAALGVGQIERLDEIIAAKRCQGELYARRLGHLTQLQLQVREPWARPVFWMHGLVLDEATGYHAAGLSKSLTAMGIETRPFFLGMHEQPVLIERGLFPGERYPVTERIAKQGLYLPSGLGLTEAQMEEVCAAVERVLA